MQVRAFILPVSDMGRSLVFGTSFLESHSIGFPFTTRTDCPIPGLPVLTPT